MEINIITLNNSHRKPTQILPHSQLLARHRVRLTRTYGPPPHQPCPCSLTPQNPAPARGRELPQPMSPHHLPGQPPVPCPNHLFPLSSQQGLQQTWLHCGPGGMRDAGAQPMLEAAGTDLRVLQEGTEDLASPSGLLSLLMSPPCGATTPEHSRNPPAVPRSPGGAEGAPRLRVLAVPPAPGLSRRFSPSLPSPALTTLPSLASRRCPWAGGSAPLPPPPARPSPGERE